MSFIGNNPKFNTGTLTPQSADPTSPTEGMQFYSDGTSRPEGLYVYKNGNWINLQSGSGELNFYEQGDADQATISDFTSGNNATFDGGGTVQGVFSISTTAADIISGTSAFKLVLHATPGTSDDDYVASTALDIPQGYRGRNLTVKMQYKYDGANDDIKIVIKDQTNGNILTVGDELLPISAGANDVAKEFTFSFFCPSDCLQVKFGPQVLTHATGSEELIWDDVVISPSQLAIGSLSETQFSWFSGFAGKGSTATSIPYFTNEQKSTGTSLYTLTNDSTDGMVLTVNKACKINMNMSAFPDANLFCGFSVNASSVTAEIQDVAEGERLALEEAVDASEAISFGAVYDAIPGDIIRPHFAASGGSGSNGRWLVQFAAEQLKEVVVSPTDNVQPIRYTTDAGNTIINTTTTYIDFEDIDFDDDGLVLGAGSGNVTTTGTGWRWIAPRAGKINLHSMITIADTSAWDADDTLEVAIVKNGSEVSVKFGEISGDDATSPAGSFIVSGLISDLVSVSRDDIIEIKVRVSVGAGLHAPPSVNMDTGVGRNYISVDYIDKKAISAASGDPTIQYTWYSNASGLGSSNTKIPYFATEQKSSGAGLYTVTNDSTNGFVITTLQPCLVSMKFWNFGTTANHICIGLNSNGTTDAQDLSDANRLGLSEATDPTNAQMVVGEYVAEAGDTFKPHTQNTAVSSSARWGITVTATRL